MKTLHKKLHKKLHLKHHKHTGKVIPHKHTSYRVLFLLLLAPIIMLAFVNHMSALAADYIVSATVPAPVPVGAPVIALPSEDFVASSSTVVIKGSCPVTVPPILVVIYLNDLFAGSTVCGNSGVFEVPVTLSNGENIIVAKVMTITNEFGESSSPRKVIWRQPEQPQTPQTTPIYTPLAFEQQKLLRVVYILTQNLYLLINQNGQVTWRGSFNGGKEPYNITIDWGDEKRDKYSVTDQSEQTFSHAYQTIKTYQVVVTAMDDLGNSASLSSVAISPQFLQRIGLDSPLESNPGLVTWVRQNFWQIYISTIFATLFLWYLEKGRHIQKRIIRTTIHNNRSGPRHLHR